MWQRIISFSVITIAASLGRPLLAQPAPAQQAIAQPAAAQPAQQHEPARCSRRVSGSLWSQVEWLRLEISGGRIAVFSTRCGQARLTAEPAEGSELRQMLLVDSQPSGLVATFEVCDKLATLRLELNERKQLTITRQGLADADVVEVRYTQPPTGPVCLVIGSDPSNKLTAPSLWHLLLTEPQASREHLLPLLHQIRPSWRLPAQLAQVEAALAAQAGTDLTAQRREWQTWVDQLNDDSFVRRSQADQALRGAGQSVLAFLRQLDSASLNVEQRRRIRAILDAADPSPDSPDRVAAWLADDRRVWLSLLAGESMDHRLAAARHLSRLSGRTVSFDPGASADQRAEQLIQLRALLSEQ